jgi:hypothetical protein
MHVCTPPTLPLTPAPPPSNSTLTTTQQTPTTHHSTPFLPPRRLCPTLPDHTLSVPSLPALNQRSLPAPVATRSRAAGASLPGGVSAAGSGGIGSNTRPLSRPTAEPGSMAE